MSIGNLAEAYRSAAEPDKALPLFEQTAKGIEKARFRHQFAK